MKLVKLTANCNFDEYFVLNCVTSREKHLSVLVHYNLTQFTRQANAI